MLNTHAKMQTVNDLAQFVAKAGIPWVVRFAWRLTDVEIDAPKSYRVEETCENCDMCTKWCPGDAISPEKETVRGSSRWIVEIEKCAPYWGSYYACGICLEVCPFNARAFDGAYKRSLIERINGMDRDTWNKDLKEGLQQPWEHVVQPSNRDHSGWRNEVEGRGDAAALLQGIPKDGLPEEIYARRCDMGIAPRKNSDAG